MFYCSPQTLIKELLDRKLRTSVKLKGENWWDTGEQVPLFLSLPSLSLSEHVLLSFILVSLTLIISLSCLSSARHSCKRPWKYECPENERYTRVYSPCISYTLYSPPPLSFALLPFSLLSSPCSPVLPLLPSPLFALFHVLSPPLFIEIRTHSDNSLSRLLDVGRKGAINLYIYI